MRKYLNGFFYLEPLPRTEVNVRDHLMMMLLIDTSVRRIELRNIKLDNNNFKDYSINLTKTKTNKNRMFIYAIDLSS